MTVSLNMKMELEIRSKDGFLIGNIKGDAALVQYQRLDETPFVMKRNITTNKGTFTCFDVVDHMKMDFGGLVELIFEPGDYIKIKP